MEVYHVKTQADYDALMIKLKTEESTWNSDFPTQEMKLSNIKQRRKNVKPRM